MYRGLNQNPHPGLLQCKALFVDEGNLHVVLPWVSGGDLCNEVLGGGPLMEERARRMTRQIADALGHLHGVIGVAHLDISPENLLLATDCDGAILIDYGSCRPINGGGCWVGPHHGVALKPQYAAPELLCSASWAGLDLPKADVFGLGISLFVALFGFPPFRFALPHDPLFKTLQAAGVRGLLAKVGRSSLASSVSADALMLLDGMLQPDPVHRISVAGIRSHPWLLPAVV